MNALERENLLRIIRKQIHRYPRFEVQDLYKLLHQAACGGHHFPEDEAEARGILLAEWKDLEAPRENEPLVERIDPKEQIVRINLRPFKAQGGLPEQIFFLFKRSVGEIRPDTGLLIRYWDAVSEMAEDVELPFRIDHLGSFWESMRKEGLPPARHSQAYRRAYQPHYRIILRRFWEGREFDPSG
ncbi:MAG TPA: hypothetical protein ENN17_09905 [bacterium]|nr:hypothetical protein [bacterium]